MQSYPLMHIGWHMRVCIHTEESMTPHLSRCFLWLPWSPLLELGATKFPFPRALGCASGQPCSHFSSSGCFFLRQGGRGVPSRACRAARTPCCAQDARHSVCREHFIDAVTSPLGKGAITLQGGAWSGHRLPHR